MKHLDNAEVICDKCNGKGVIAIEITKESTLPIKTYICFKCNGTGKINWLENIFGKSEDSVGDIYYEKNGSLYRLSIGENNKKLNINSKHQLEW